MPTPVPRPGASGQANKVARPAGGGRQAGDSLSPDLIREVYGLVSRAIKAANVDAMAGECGVDRSTIWKWAKRPDRVQVGALLTLAEYDPDPESLSRIAGCILAAVAKRALAREAAGQTLALFHQINGRWIR